MNDEFKVPFLKPEFIEEKANDTLRDLHAELFPPVNIERIVEIRLRIRIIPLPNVRALIGVDGFISNNLQTITIDEQLIDPRRSNDNRYRFTLAHELGHRVLHGDLIRKLKFNDCIEWKALYLSLPPKELDWFNTHAQWFSGHLLMPRTKFVENHDKIWRELAGEGHSFEDDRDGFRDLLIKRLSKRFLVSEGAVHRRLSFIAPPIPKI
ncbi:MAG TPA: ImmA/IrrE family metallo-endopeptidase [bacterium]|jgi:hypothetical protein